MLFISSSISLNKFAPVISSGETLVKSNPIPSLDDRISADVRKKKIKTFLISLLILSGHGNGAHCAAPPGRLSRDLAAVGHGHHGNTLGCNHKHTRPVPPPLHCSNQPSPAVDAECVFVRGTQSRALTVALKVGVLCTMRRDMSFQIHLGPFRRSLIITGSFPAYKAG